MDEQWLPDPAGRDLALSVSLSQKQILEIVSLIYHEWTHNLEQYDRISLSDANRIHHFLMETITRFESVRSETIAYLHRLTIQQARVTPPAPVVMSAMHYGHYAGAPEGWTVIEPPEGTLFRFRTIHVDATAKTITVTLE